MGWYDFSDIGLTVRESFSRISALAGVEKEELDVQIQKSSRRDEVTGCFDIDKVVCTLTASSKPLATFTLNSFPGCGAITLISNAEVYDPFRGKKLGTFLHYLRLRELLLAGTPLVMCTVNTANTREVAVLHRFGWDCGQGFVNCITGNSVAVYTRKLWSSDKWAEELIVLQRHWGGG